jgi:hypothetical protein
MPIQEAHDNLDEVISRSSSTGEVVYLLTTASGWPRSCRLAVPRSSTASSR